MGKAGLFLKNVLQRRTFPHRVPVSHPDDRNKRTGSEASTDVSHVDLEAPCTIACGFPQRCSASVACPPLWAVTTCYHNSASHEFSDCSDAGYTDFWPGGAQNEVFGTLPCDADIRREIYCENCMQGAPEVAACPSVLCPGTCALDDRPCGEYVFSNVPCDLARQVCSELNPFFEFSNIGKGVTSLANKTGPCATKHVATGYRWVLQRSPTAHLTEDTHPVPEFSPSGRKGSFVPNVNKTLFLSSEHLEFSQPCADRDSRQSGTHISRGKNIRVLPEKAAVQGVAADEGNALGSGTQSVKVHPLEEASTAAGTHEKPEADEGLTDTSKGSNASPHAAQKVPEVSRCWGVAFRGSDACIGVTTCKIALAVAGVILLALTFAWIWFFFFVRAS